MSEALQPIVREIPATIGRRAMGTARKAQAKRVAAYARVSTESEEQQSSYEVQVSHYTQFIQNKQDWQFVDVYSDEGISGTSTRKCDGFNRMIRDSLDGKIDLIITKSVSRFARNTVDTLSTVRKLKHEIVKCAIEFSKSIFSKCTSPVPDTGYPLSVLGMKRFILPFLSKFLCYYFKMVLIPILSSSSNILS